MPQLSEYKNENLEEERWNSSCDLKKRQRKVNSQGHWVFLQRKWVQWVFPNLKGLEVPIRDVCGSLLVTHRSMLIAHTFQQAGIAALCAITLVQVGTFCTSSLLVFPRSWSFVCMSLLHSSSAFPVSDGGSVVMQCSNKAQHF